MPSNSKRGRSSSGSGRRKRTGAPPPSARRGASSSRQQRPASRAATPEARALLDYLAVPGRKPQDFNHLAEALGYESLRAKKTLKRLLRSLAAEGALKLDRDARYTASSGEEGLVKGYFEAHRDGYGFLVPEAAGERDLFIPERATLYAMDADRVLARVEDLRRRSGRIVRILERTHTRIAGTVALGPGGQLIVRPKRAGGAFEVHLAEEHRAEAKEGQTVIVEILEYPAEGRPATGKVLKVLAPSETARQELDAVAEEFHLPQRFPRSAVLPASLPDYSGEPGRVDLTHLPLVTIDGEKARDFDDAISIERQGSDYVLGVHIADVGHYVDWDTPLDEEARKRATSVYLPDRVVPMLPKSLSEDLCSLMPEVKRAAFTVSMRFNSQGGLKAVKFHKSIIKSAARMTYTSVSKIVVDRDVAERARYKHLVPAFELMAELAALLRDERFRRGSLDFDLPEPEIVLDMQGTPEAIVRAERNFAHMIIEEFMIRANEAVASFLESRKLPCLYRVHDKPEEIKVREVLRMAGIPFKKGRGHSPQGGPRGPQGVGGSIEAQSVAQALRHVKGRPEEEEISYMVLRSMKQAKYSPENTGHFGLASVSYAHFTSPIRRYPDLVVHRILASALGLRKGGVAKDVEAVLQDIASHASRRERLALEAERASIEAMRAWFMKGRIGHQMDCTVMGVRPEGLRIRLTDCYVEGFLPTETFKDDLYEYDKETMSLRGRRRGGVLKFGSALRVLVRDVDMEGRRVVFDPLPSAPVKAIARGTLK